MNLVIDIGNTIIKLAVYELNQFVERQVATDEDFSEVLQIIVDSYPKIDWAIWASVREYPSNWSAILPEGATLIKLDSSTRVPFENCYETPKSLGNDRLALAAAAVALFPDKNVMVIDAGTCITYDLINAEGQFLGGAISPGLQMRFRAMHNFTGKLPLLVPETRVRNDKPGSTTNQCMQLGAVKGMAYEVEGFVKAYRDKYKVLTVILTGGDSEFLSNTLKNSIFAPSNFLLTGLNRILEFNKN